jgi:hypothetical protein
MKMPKVWYVYYGLAVIWTFRRIKSIVRHIGELMKVRGRALIAWGEDSIPQWSIELFCKCYLVDTEVHVSGEVYRGRIDSMHQKFSGKDKDLVLKLKSVTRRKKFASREEASEDREFKLGGYGSPVIIKEDDCDCIWFSFNKGYVAIYFRRPLKEY